MMQSASALRTAVDLLHFPSQAALIRAGPLPDGVPILLKIAAGDDDVINCAAATLGRSPETVREAAAFFLEQVLLHPGADSYRVLGANQDASHSELRKNMSWLLQWLHPDLDRQEVRSVFARRVTRAWNDVKTPERRAAYDRGLGSARAKKLSSHGQGPSYLSPQRGLMTNNFRGMPQYRTHLKLPPDRSYAGTLRKLLIAVFGRSVYWK
jgi:hypothetical protein